MTPSDRQRAAVAGLVALGSAALAYGRRKRREETDAEFVEVPLDG